MWLTITLVVLPSKVTVGYLEFTPGFVYNRMPLSTTPQPIRPIPVTLPSTPNATVVPRASSSTPPPPTEREVSSEGTDVPYLVPVLIAIGIILLLILILTGVLLYRRRRQKNERQRRIRQQVEDLLKTNATSSSSSSWGGSDIQSDPSLPPLPLDSVFGPDRVTGRPRVGSYYRLISAPNW